MVTIWVGRLLVPATPAAAVATAPLVWDRQRYDLKQQEILVGRSSSADICLATDAVSLIHLRIYCVKGLWWVVDLESTNGTSVDQVALLPNIPCRLELSQFVSLGDYVLMLSLPDAQPPLQLVPQTTASFARGLLTQQVGDRVASQWRPWLHVLNGPQATQMFQLVDTGARYSLGRGEDCDFVLVDVDCSRHHCVVFECDGKVWISDAGSKNGVKVNGIAVEEKQQLNHQDEIVMGGTLLRFVDPMAAYMAALPVGSLPSPIPDAQPEMCAEKKSDEKSPPATPPMQHSVWRDTRFLMGGALLIAAAAAAIAYLNLS